MRKIVSLFALFMLAFAVVASRVDVGNAEAVPAKFSLVPMFSIKAATVGNTFTVDIRVDYVVNLNTWGVRIWWDHTVLECMGAVEGPFLTSGGGSTLMPPPTIDNEIGMMYVGSGLLSSASVSGGGVVATATFKVLAVDTTGFWATENSCIDPAFNPIASEWKVIDIFTVWDIALNYAPGVGVTPGSPGDINEDGYVDVWDLILVGQYYGNIGIASGSP